MGEVGLGVGFDREGEGWVRSKEEESWMVWNWEVYRVFGHEWMVGDERMISVETSPKMAWAACWNGG